jgi:hypothetical protein
MKRRGGEEDVRNERNRRIKSKEIEIIKTYP